MDNIFKHNSRSYFDIYNALVAAYPNKPTWLFTEMAGMFDFQSELMNRIATDILYPKTRESAYAFAARCDYDPVEASGATTTVNVTLTGSMSKTIAVGYQFGGVSAATGKMVIFEVTTATSVVGGSVINNVPVEQKKTYGDISDETTLINIGTISNTDDFADYLITGYENIIKNSVAMKINSETWTRVDNFDNSISTDKHFRLIYQSSGKCRVQFGNGTTGLKPAMNSTILLSFSVTEGTLGRLNTGEITINVGGDNQISSLTNSADCSGGADSESVASILRNARANARLRQMVWSKEDLETAAKAADSSVIKALGIPGTGTASIHIIPTGGGAASGSLITDVDTYVTALTQFGSMPINVYSFSSVTTTITATITVRTGYTSATVQKLTEFALRLASSCFDVEILESYSDNGIDYCRTSKIMTLWSAYFSSFTSTENDALEYIITRWISLLGTRSSREWGQPLEVGDLWIMGNDIYDYGVDVFTLTAPTVNTTVTSSQIIANGAVTVTVV